MTRRAGFFFMRAMTLYERRAPRWVHVACLIPTIALTAFMIHFVFLREPEIDAFGRSDELDLTFKVLFGFFCAIGVFMTGVFTYRIVRNPAYFTLTEEGFYYAPGGVSTGLIRWSDIVEIKEETVIEGTQFGPGYSPAVAVVLRNPEEYIARYPQVMKPLFAVRGQLNSSPLMLRRADFGPDYAAIRQIMDEQVRQYAGIK